MLFRIKVTLTAKAAKPNRPRPNVLKLGNTQVNRGSKIFFFFNGLSKEVYHLRNVKLYSESAELVTTYAAV